MVKAQVGHDISVGGPGLAALAIRSGLVDEYQLFIAPIVVGGGNYYLPHDVFLILELLEQRRFDNGMVYLHHTAR
jgi:riboflavin biosynthesis pyrimidine reductase